MEWLSVTKTCRKHSSGEAEERKCHLYSTFTLGAGYLLTQVYLEQSCLNAGGLVCGEVPGLKTHLLDGKEA